MYEEIVKALTDLRFWDQVCGDARRTVVAHPDKVERLRAAVAEAGLDGMVTVLANPILTPEQAYVIDTPAIEAYERQGAQAMLRRPLF